MTATNNQVVEQGVLQFVRRYHRGVRETLILEYLEKSIDPELDTDLYVDVLWSLVMSGKLNCRLPRGVKEDTDRALTTPLIYSCNRGT